jgi:hypothetical protein
MSGWLPTQSRTNATTENAVLEPPGSNFVLTTVAIFYTMTHTRKWLAFVYISDQERGVLAGRQSVLDGLDCINLSKSLEAEDISDEL